MQTWLDSEAGRRINFVAIQETHWRGPLEYQSGRFLAVHSGASKAGAGLLPLVNTRKNPQHLIKHVEVIPGRLRRLLHVRIETEPCIDLVLIYQHAWSVNRNTSSQATSQVAVLARRAEL